MITLKKETINRLFNKNVDWFNYDVRSDISVHSKYDNNSYNIHNYLDLSYLQSLGCDIFLIENEEMECLELIF
jgi:hypothetical protein